MEQSKKASNFSGYVKDEDVLFLVKFGKKEHLEQIVSGETRFSPSQKYVEQEKKLHDKGQGDLLEGKMKLHVESYTMESHEDGRIIKVNHPEDFLINIQDVNDMPIICYLCGTYEDCSEYKAPNEYIINFSEDVKETIIKDFHNPDSALIIFEPQRYIKDMQERLNTVSSSIRYYDYSKMWIQQYMFLCKGDEDAEIGNGIMTYDNRYRHLLCKDIAFKNQKEYRFIKLDELIDSPKTYEFAFDYDYEIVPCEKLFSGFTVKK